VRDAGAVRLRWQWDDDALSACSTASHSGAPYLAIVAPAPRGDRWLWKAWPEAAPDQIRQGEAVGCAAAMTACEAAIRAFARRSAARRNETEAKGARVYLSVPYSEKERAARLGADWDVRRGAWYVPAGSDLDRFTPWLRPDAAPAAIARRPSSPARRRNARSR
jgi:hypothetical protein